MDFIRSLFILCVLLVCAVVSAAQEAGGCRLKLAQLAEASELYGLHTGMTVEQVKGRVPSIEMGPTDASGLSKTSFSPAFNPAMDKKAYQGVRTISLEFLDGRVTALWIGYDAAFKWQNLDEFVPGMSRALGLSNAAWKQRPRGGQQLDCVDFQVTAVMIAGSPALGISDQTAKQTWEDRQAVAEEAQEKEAPEPR
jgi:hypothetical protein